MICDHGPQRSDTGELEQKCEGCECFGVSRPGAVLSSHPSQGSQRRVTKIIIEKKVESVRSE